MSRDLSAEFLHVASRFWPRFKVFADYEDYISCQEKVDALYKVSVFKSRIIVGSDLIQY